MPKCLRCFDQGWVCEAHETLAWGGGLGDCDPRGCHCGAPGMPCALCYADVPQDGTHSINEIFTSNVERH